MKERMTWMLTGAAIMGLGVIAGRVGTEPTAHAQVVAQRDVSGEDIFMSGNPALITTSADGKTLHFWTFSNAGEQLNDEAMPRFVASRSADEEKD